MSPAEVNDVRARARDDVKGGNIAAAIARLEGATCRAHPDVQFELCRLYFKTGNWDCVNTAARAALELERPIEDVFHLLSAIVTAAHRTGRKAALRGECGGMLRLLRRAMDRFHPNLGIESTAGLRYWQMALAIAFGCNDIAAALEIYRQRGAAVCPLAANAAGAALSPISTVAIWCDASGFPHSVVDPPQRVTIQPAKPGTDGWSYDTDVFAVAVIPGGEFVSGWDFVRTPSGEVLADSGYVGLETNFQSFSPHTYFKELNIVGHLWPTDKTHVDEEALFLSTPERFHVGHWIVDFLPRLRALDVGGAKEIALAVPTEISKKQVDLLNLFGIDPARLIRCDLGKRYSFRSLRVASVGSALRPNPETVKFLGAAMRPPSTARRATRLFLSRATGTRRIVNQPEIDLELSAFGFEHIDLARMTITEQRAKVGGAEIVVGVLGSDVLACFFMQPDSHLVEFNWDPAQDAATGPYCALQGVNYHQLLGTIAAAPGAKTQKKDHDFRIDRTALRHLFESLGLTRSP